MVGCQVRKLRSGAPPRPKMGVGCCQKPAMRTLSEGNAGVTQLVEYLPSKQAVASSSLVPRSQIIDVTERKTTRPLATADS
jgi:hypothetical protein